MGSESMAHEPNAEWAIDVDSGHEDERDNFFSKIQLVGQKLACSKRSDSGERCEVKKAMKSRGGLEREVRERGRGRKEGRKGGRQAGCII